MNYLIFGGSGFIGNHLARYIAEQGTNIDSIYNLDIKNNNVLFKNFVNLDVRKPVEFDLDDISSSIIFNLSAIHITPGFADKEYFETNILGAENICNFARAKKINTIVFTSSIAPYGVSEDLKTETSIPMPATPYGISKLTAEYIHREWLAEDPGVRKLIILRPGVVFGKNEGGNFTRLYNSLKKGFFFFPGRKDTIKAAVYVKDTARILYETALFEPCGLLTLNLTYFPAPNINDICIAIAGVTNVKEPKIVIPAKPLIILAGILYMIARFFGKKLNGIHPDRVKKLMLSTNISGEKLENTRYKLRYSLTEAISDWFQECENEGLY